MAHRLVYRGRSAADKQVRVCLCIARAPLVAWEQKSRTRVFTIVCLQSILSIPRAAASPRGQSAADKQVRVFLRVSPRFFGLCFVSRRACGQRAGERTRALVFLYFRFLSSEYTVHPARRRVTPCIRQAGACGCASQRAWETEGQKNVVVLSAPY